MARLESATGHATAQVSPDGNSVIFQRKNSTEQIYWPAKDWEELDRYVRSKIGADSMASSSTAQHQAN